MLSSAKMITNGNIYPSSTDPALVDILRLLAERTTTSSQPGASYQVIPDLTQSVGDFCGETGQSSEASLWLSNFTVAADLHQWSDGLRVQMARRHLTGAAHDWMLCRLETIKTWDGFVAAFKRTFVAEASFSQRYAQMQSRIQQRGESTYTYFHNKVRLCEAVKLEFMDVKEQVLLGLWSRDLARTLVGARHQDTDELLSDIMCYERVEQNRIEREEGSRSKPVFQKGATHSKPSNEFRQRSYGMSVRREEQAPQNNNYQRPRTTQMTRSMEVVRKHEAQCWRCGQTGHLLRDCPKKQTGQVKCEQCGWTGAHKWTCVTLKGSNNASRVLYTQAEPENPKVVEAADVVNYIKLDYRSCNGATLHHKEVVINDTHQMVGLIDSGSSTCIMRESVARSIGVTWNPTETLINGFGPDAVTKAIGSAVTKVQIDEAVLEGVPVLIVPDRSSPQQLIIGRPWCEAPTISFVKNEQGLRYYNHHNFPFVEMQMDKTMDLTLRVKSDAVLPPGEVTLVTAKIGDEEISVPVGNGANQDAMLKANQILARRVALKPIDLVEDESFTRALTFEEIKKPETLTPEQQSELLKIVNKYRCCFAVTLSELGFTGLTKMDIIVQPGSVPYAAKPYRTSREERVEIARQVQQWRDHGIVEDTTSPYAAPVLLVKKKSGEARMVVDYRRLNGQTIRQPYPLPTVDDLLEQLAGSTLYTVLDLAHGYLQIPLSDEARAKTAFVTADGSGQFTRMVFGLCNAPFEFARTMDKAMGTLKNRVVLNYFDDYFIPARDWDEMKERLVQVFEAFKAANLTLRPSKCVFASRSIEFLGFKLSADGLQPGPHKQAAIAEFKTPSTVVEVRRFMDLASFFRRFVHKFAELARPMTDLTKKDVPFTWGDKEQKAFEQMKILLVQAPVLRTFDATKITELHTDASSKGLAAMLLQKGDDGPLHLVHCLSKKTSSTEEAYHSSRLELMAIVWALDRLRSWLLGIHVTIVTDCQALVYMNATKTTNPQIARWFDLIQEYDIDVKHRAGEAMSHVDALSRAPVEEATETVDTLVQKRVEVLISMNEADYVRSIQSQDPEMSTIMSTLSEGTASRQVAANYQLKDGLLYRKQRSKDGERLLWAVPASMRKGMVVRFHDMAGHMGVDRTVTKLTEKYYFPRLRRYVKHHIGGCPECVLFKIPRGKRPGMLHPISPGSRPFATVNGDHLGPFPTSRRGNTYLFILVDNLTKYCRLYPCRRADSSTVIRHMEDFMYSFGRPQRLITDRGTAFTSLEFERFCRNYGVDHHLIAVRHPRANGQVERINSTVLASITTTIASEHTWDQNLRKLEFFLNTAINATTGVTPFKALYGYSAVLQDGALDAIVGQEQEYVSPMVVQAEVRTQIEKGHDIWRQQHDAHKTDQRLEQGTIVFLRCPPSATGGSTKLQVKYRGPMVVLEQCPGDTYKIADLDDSMSRRYATTAHISLLKAFKGHAEAPEYEGPGDKRWTHRQNKVVESTDQPPEGISTVPSRQSSRTRRLPSHLNTYDLS